MNKQNAVVIENRNYYANVDEKFCPAFFAELCNNYFFTIKIIYQI